MKSNSKDRVWARECSKERKATENPNSMRSIKGTSKARSKSIGSDRIKTKNPKKIGSTKNTDRRGRKKRTRTGGNRTRIAPHTMR